MGKLNTIQNGKGCKPRPVKDLNSFVDNWDLIFKKNKKKKLAKKEETSNNT